MPNQDLTAVLVLASAGFLAFSGLSAVIPILPLYGRAFGAGDVLIGLLIAGFAISRVALDIPAGVVSDRFPLKRVALAGLILIIISALTAAFASSYAVLLAARLLEGAGSAFYLTAATALLARITRPENRGRVMGIFTVSLLAGGAPGPLLGGLTAKHFGLNAPFLLYAFLVALGVIVVAGRLKVDGPRTSPAGETVSLSGLGALLRDLSFVLVALAVFGVFFGWSAIDLTAALLYAYENLRLTEETVGFVYAVATVPLLLIVLPAGHLADRIGRKLPMMSCLLLTALVAAMIPFTSNLPQYALTMAVYGLAAGLSGPIFAWSADLAPKERLGAALGLTRMMGDAGFIGGPLLAGFLISITRTPLIHPTPFLAVAAILAALGVALTAARDPSGEMARLRRPPQPR